MDTLALPLVGADGGVGCWGAVGSIGVIGRSPDNGCHCCSGVREAMACVRVEVADSKRAETSSMSVSG
jgi:hypothetical protein